MHSFTEFLNVLPVHETVNRVDLVGQAGDELAQDFGHVGVVGEIADQLRLRRRLIGSGVCGGEGGDGFGGGGQELAAVDALGEISGAAGAPGLIRKPMGTRRKRRG